MKYSPMIIIIKSNSGIGILKVFSRQINYFTCSLVRMRKAFIHPQVVCVLAVPVAAFTFSYRTHISLGHTHTLPTMLDL